MRDVKWIALLGCLTVGCSGSPTSPTTPTTYTLTGTLTATNGGQGLAGATITAGGVSSTTDASGRYSLNLSQPAPSFTISGAGLVTRSGHFAGQGSRNVNLEAFGPGFDLAYFRQIARASLSGAPTALVHATQNPRIFISTVDVTGAAVAADAVDFAVSLVQTWTPPLTGQHYTAVVTTGTTAPAGAYVITWDRAANLGFCGRTTVDGLVRLAYDAPTCTCEHHTSALAVKHELGHLMGLAHTDTASDLMVGGPLPACNRDPSPRELEYARYLYSRPVGSLDQDADPANAPQ